MGYNAKVMQLIISNDSFFIIILNLNVKCYLICLQQKISSNDILTPGATLISVKDTNCLRDYQVIKVTGP